MKLNFIFIMPDRRESRCDPNHGPLCAEAAGSYDTLNRLRTLTNGSPASSASAVVLIWVEQ